MSANPELYLHEGQQRILRLITLLAGHEVTGIAPAQLATLNECSQQLVHRDLANLQIAGMAERVPDTNLWRLAPQIVQIAIKHSVALDRARTRLTEVTNRFSRS